MDDHTLDDLRVARERFVARLRERSERRAAPGEDVGDLPEERQRELLADLKGRVEVLRRARESAIQRYDEDVARYADVIAQLEEAAEAREPEPASGDPPAGAPGTHGPRASPGKKRAAPKRSRRPKKST